jgi:hypothetical protein
MKTFLAILAALAISGCGDSSSGPEPLATGSSTTQGGDANTGHVLLMMALQGPEMALEAPQTVCVRVSAKVAVQAHYGAIAHVGLALQQPTATGANTIPVQLAARPDNTASIDYAVALQIPAGHVPMLAVLTARAFDAATGFSTSALGRAEAQAEWFVTAGECD